MHKKNVSCGVMDIENLTKSQIVLLTLLVSFVTSIATGIVTVSLMEQAPPTVAQTVNRVVERTVERVVPPDESQVAAPVVTTETVVVREADLIAEAVAKATPALVRLYDPESGAFVSFGVALPDGRVLTDAAAIEEGSAITRDGESIVEFTVTGRNSALGLAVLNSASTTEETSWGSLAISTDAPVLGQTAIAFSGENTPRVTNTIVTAIAGENILETNIPTDATYAGAPLINIDGELIGIRTRVAYTAAPGGFINAQSIRGILNTTVQTADSAQ